METYLIFLLGFIGGAAACLLDRMLHSGGIDA